MYKSVYPLNVNREHHDLVSLEIQMVCSYECRLSDKSLSLYFSFCHQIRKICSMAQRKKICQADFHCFGQFGPSNKKKYQIYHQN